MIRAHRIQPNEQTRIPRRFVYLDTEARRRDDDERVQTWRCAVTAFERSDTDDHHWTGLELRDWTDPESMWEYVVGRTRRRSRTVCVAHNLAYDLRIARGFHHLPRLGWRIDRLGLHDRSLSVTWRRDDRSLVMVDSHSWIPASLDEIARDRGTQKLPLPDWDAPLSDWLDRCRQDVTILRDAYREVIDWIRDADLGNWQRTGAGMAWANWRHRHYTHQVIVHDVAEARDAEVAATYTGRCEAWRWGQLEPGPFTEWDLPLAYARVALDTELPTRLLHRLERPSLGRVLLPIAGRRSLVRATVTSKDPTLPVRDPRGIIWPTGTFTGWWWDDELAAAMRFGASVEPHAAFVYASAPMLADWAAWVIEAAEGRDPSISPLARRVTKHWARALIGRFAARYREWETWGTWPTETVQSATWIDSDTGESGTQLVVGHDVYLARGETFGADAFPGVMAAVMAQARVRLWHIMTTAGLDHLVYCDTDSVITDPIGTARIEAALRADPLWGLRVKRSWQTLTVWGPRQLALDGLPRFAGIPYRARLSQPGTFTGERWQSLTTSLAHGTADQVAVSSATWKVTGADHRRTHHVDGSTSAVHLSAEIIAREASVAS